MNLLTICIQIASTDEESAIHVAAATGNILGIKLLLQDNLMLLRQQNAEGNTPLHVAAKNNHHYVVDFLVECGAHMDAKNNAQLTPYMLAEQNEAADVVTVLEELVAFEKANGCRKSKFIFG